MNIKLSVRVKICGITNIEDASACLEAGADAIGLNFYDKSPRYIEDLGLAREIAQHVGPFVTVVALTVNSGTKFIENLLRQVPVHVLQFHGDETEPFCHQFNYPYCKAIRVGKDGQDLAQEMQSYNSSVGILLDTYVKGTPGGTGERFNWDLIPLDMNQNLVLAGGLNSQNVVSAIDTCQPYGVDVSGGVESSPGIKDKQKMKDFINLAKFGAVSE